MPRSILAAFALATASLTLAAPAAAEKAPVYTGLFSDIAVGGHDPVAYFTEGMPVKGKAKFSTEYKSATFRFATAENLALFEENPEKYAPQYGGYCAWAVAEGKTAKGDPEYWKIVDGKLYLNYNKKIQERWEQDQASYIVKADTNWPEVLK